MQSVTLRSHTTRRQLGFVAYSRLLHNYSAACRPMIGCYRSSSWT